MNELLTKSREADDNLTRHAESLLDEAFQLELDASNKRARAFYILGKAEPTPRCEVDEDDAFVAEIDAMVVKKGRAAK